MQTYAEAQSSLKQVSYLEAKTPPLDNRLTNQEQPEPDDDDDDQLQ